MMRGVKAVVLVFAVVVASLGGKWAEAQVQHVVGGDQGWDPSSGVSSWSADKVFRIGDRIWLAYSAAQGSVAEVRSREEFEACNVSNPMRMYTDGLDSIPLDSQGSRFFASTNANHCKNGLKLSIEVMPLTYPGPGILQVTASEERQTIIADVAAGPTSPSASPTLAPPTNLLFALAFLCVAFGH